MPLSPLVALPCLPSDVVRKIIYGDVDLGIVGLDMLAEIGNDDPGTRGATQACTTA